MKILSQSRSGYYKAKGSKRQRAKHYECQDDHEISLKIKQVIKARPTYGYKRITALLNRDYGMKYNRKRIYRIMRIKGLLMARKPVATDRRQHTGKVMVLHSDTRWCSDCFEVRCWNDEKVYVIFAIDCCDREVISYYASTESISSKHVADVMEMAIDARFKDQDRAPHIIQWLSDRGAIYRSQETQHRARMLGLKPCFTAAYSPSSNGMAEAFVGTIKRDYVYTNDCQDADTTLRLLPQWIKDYNEKAPHSALAMKTPSEYRNSKQTG
jgi:putative transposase